MMMTNLDDVLVDDIRNLGLNMNERFQPPQHNPAAKNAANITNITFKNVHTYSQ